MCFFNRQSVHGVYTKNYYVDWSIHGGRIIKCKAALKPGIRKTETGIQNPSTIWILESGIPNLESEPNILNV